MSAIGSIGASIQAVNLTSEPIGNSISSGTAVARSSAASLTKSDAMNSGVSTGSIPAVRVGLVGKLSNSTNYVAKSTINATKEFGNVIANDVLPKPEPLSATIMRNKFLSAVLVGGFVNGITSLVKVAKGEYTQEEAGHAVLRDTSMGAISGLSFAGGMGLTASVLGGIIGGVPLSVAALTIGTLSSIAVSGLASEYIPFFQNKKTN